MDPDDTPETELTRASPKNFSNPLRSLVTPFKHVPIALKQLSIPKKLVIPAIAGAVLLAVGGATFGLLHAKLKHIGAPQPKAAASAAVASVTKPSTACNGVVRDIYRQTVAEGQHVTLTEVRAEVGRSGVTCVPVPEITAGLKDLSSGCRDMVQYTFLGVHDGHAEIKVSDVREKVVEKSVACEHDRRSTAVSVQRHEAR